MTVELNRNDLIRHADEFYAREAFAYAVFSPAKDRYIGCVYINPTNNAEDYDCELYLWVRDSEVHLDEAFFNGVESWLKAECPFIRLSRP